jgi:outer membrane immunogenic protein
MRKLLSSCVGVFCAAALVGPALADEPPPVKRQRAAAPERVAAAPQQQGAKWSGGQVGGSNGVSSVNNNFVDPGAFVCPVSSSGSNTFGSSCFETPFQFSGHKASYTIGPFVGYRLQFGGWVVGIEGDWSWKNSESSLSQSSSTAISAGTTTTSFFDSFSGTIISSTVPNNYFRTDSFAGSVKQKSDSSIRARVGWLVTPWSLLYVTGGVAFSEISGSFAYSGTLYSCGSNSATSLSSCAGSSSSPLVSVATASTAVSWNDTRVGSTVGAGWEQELFPGWKWRAEYRWTDFGDYTKTFGLATRCTSSPSSPASSCTSSPSSSVSINLKESFHTFRIGLAFDL